MIEYVSLVAHAAEHGKVNELKVDLTLRATLENDQLAWTAKIDNREEGIEISEIWLPWLYGLNDLGLGRGGDVLYWPEGAGRRIENPLLTLTREEGPIRPLRLTYPWNASMQWFTFNNGEEGLYVGSHDRTLMTTCLNVGADRRGGLSASMVKYPFVKSGETWASEPVITRLYRGDWHEASRFYQAWASTWMRRPHPAEWIRRSPGWAHPALGTKWQSGHMFGSYADYPSMLKDAQALGINTLMVFGWVKQGFDNRYPDYDADEQMGGARGLREAIAEVQRTGGKLILYTQGDSSTRSPIFIGRRVSAWPPRTSGAAPISNSTHRPAKERSLRSCATSSLPSPALPPPAGRNNCCHNSKWSPATGRMASCSIRWAAGRLTSASTRLTTTPDLPWPVGRGRPKTCAACGRGCKGLIPLRHCHRVAGGLLRRMGGHHTRLGTRLFPGARLFRRTFPLYLSGGDCDQP